jgi:hypothetical protein
MSKQRKVQYTAQSFKREQLKRVVELREEATQKYDAVQQVDFAFFQKLVDVASVMGVAPISASVYVPYYDNGTGGTARLSMVIEHVEGMKSPDVQGLIGYLDLKLGTTETRDNATSYSAEKVFEFGSMYKGYSCELRVDLENAQTCKRIKTITEKTTEVVMYKLVCND